MHCHVSECPSMRATTNEFVGDGLVVPSCVNEAKYSLEPRHAMPCLRIPELS